MKMQAMQPRVVMVVSRPEVAERTLLAGDLPCQRCRGALRQFGNGRTRHRDRDPAAGPLR